MLQPLIELMKRIKKNRWYKLKKSTSEYRFFKKYAKLMCKVIALNTPISYKSVLNLLPIYPVTLFTDASGGPLGGMGLKFGKYVASSLCSDVPVYFNESLNYSAPSTVWDKFVKRF